MREQEEKRKKKKRTKKQRQKRKIIFTVITLVLMIILLIMAYFAAKLGKLDKMKMDDVEVNDGLDTSGMKGFTTLALFGIDNRTNGNFQSGNSDTMIIASINNKTGEVKMVSLYRDTYLDIGEGVFRKANAAYGQGNAEITGPERAVSMMNKNLDLNISDYVAVDFNALVEVIDLLGGIEIEVTEEEAGYMNSYIDEITGVTGKTSSHISGGMQTLDGVQSTAYARVRYTSGWDFKRTERQRLVIQKMFEKAKGASLTTLNSVLDSALPDVSTSLGNTELLGMMMKIGKYNLGENTGFPFEHAGVSAGNLGEVVVAVDLAANVRKLHEFLYGETDFTVSPTVQGISDTIKNQLGY